MLPVSWIAGKRLSPPPIHTPSASYCPLLSARAQVARYLLSRGIPSVGVIVGEGPVEGGDVQAAAGPGNQAQPSLAGGGFANETTGIVHVLRDTLHRHCSVGWWGGVSHRGPETTGSPVRPQKMEDCVLCVPVVMIL